VALEEHGGRVFTLRPGVFAKRSHYVRAGRMVPLFSRLQSLGEACERERPP